MRSDFKVYLGRRRLIAVSNRAKGFMYAQTATFRNGGYVDMVMEKFSLYCAIYDILYRRMSIVDGNGRKIGYRRMRKILYA
jgi:hypothetical protein